MERTCPINQSIDIRQVKSHHRFGGKIYISISLQWDYKKGTVQLLISGYVCAALTSFQQQKPKQPQDSSYPCTQPMYGKSNQMLNQKNIAEE